MAVSVQIFTRTIARTYRLIVPLANERLSPLRAHLSPASAHYQGACGLCTPPHLRTMASTTIPKTMRGILIEKTGGPEVLQYKKDLPVPEPKEGEILVKNDYIGINYIDTYVLYPSRAYQHQTQLSNNPESIPTNRPRPLQLLPDRPLPIPKARNPRPRSRRQHCVSRPRIPPTRPPNR